jgi:hypothetical protein
MPDIVASEVIAQLASVAKPNESQNRYVYRNQDTVRSGTYLFFTRRFCSELTRKLVEEFSFSPVQFLATDWQLLLEALWPGEENPVQNIRMDAHNRATKTTGRMG